MDKHYRTVKTIESYGGGTSGDMHEFKMTPFSNGTSVLMTVYQPRQYDLTTNPKFNIKGGMGWIVEGVFQEIEIDTGRLLFEWRSLDHFDPSTAWTWPHSTDTSGDGVTEWHPWDYFHLNSIDKNANGDYLISARHTCAIYKISGKDGSIIWSLGGSNPDFEQANFVFSYQHHARWMFENSTHTVLSFFDNAGNGYNFTADSSHGFVVEISHVEKKARLVRKWGAPDTQGGVRSNSQGSIQILPNGGAHIGWGEKAFFSEHTAEGLPVMYGQLASPGSGVPSYRSYKCNWTGLPLTKPALWTFSKFGKDKMVLYASWNGATEVRSWNFFLGNSSSGPWHYVGSAKKRGFETVFDLMDYADWAYAQALDAHGHVMEESIIARTFVPSESLRKYCGDGYCQPGELIREEDSEFKAFEDVFQIDEYYQSHLSTQRGFNTANYYTVNGSARANLGHFPSKGSEDAYDMPWTEEDNDSYDDSGHAYPHYSDLNSRSKSMVLFIGIVIGFVTAMFLSCLHSIRPFRRLEPLVDRVQRKAFGFKSHKYHRVRVKDDDTADPLVSSNGESIEL